MFAVIGTETDGVVTLGAGGPIPLGLARRRLDLDARPVTVICPDGITRTVQENELVSAETAAVLGARALVEAPIAADRRAKGWKPVEEAVVSAEKIERQPTEVEYRDPETGLIAATDAQVSAAIAQAVAELRDRRRQEALDEVVAAVRAKAVATSRRLTAAQRDAGLVEATAQLLAAELIPPLPSG